MEVAQLTLGQLNAYVSYWIGASNSEEKEGAYTDLEMFNLMAGIPKVVRKK